MIEIAISDFRKNMKYYTSKLENDDLMIISNGKPIMKIENPNKNRIKIAESLLGCIPAFDENKVMESKLKEL